MEQRITHACGHEQVHHLTGYNSQQERKARWLATTTCRSCFIANKKAGDATSTALSNDALAHFRLSPMTGSDRQIGWASAIRMKRLAALVAAFGVADDHACLQMTDAKWWIDHRDLRDVDLMSAAMRQTDPANVVA